MYYDELESSLTEFLEKRGFEVRTGSAFPSTFDVLATRGDNLVLIEMKRTSRIDSTDIARLKSHASMLSRELGFKSVQAKVFLFAEGNVTGSAIEASKELRIPIYNPNNIDKFYSLEIFRKK
jgi:Holliday junction resolvase